MISLQQENIIKAVTQRVNPTLLGVFGSYARGEENDKSDLDILIDFAFFVAVNFSCSMQQWRLFGSIVLNLSPQYSHLYQKVGSCRCSFAHTGEQKSPLPRSMSRG